MVAAEPCHLIAGHDHRIQPAVFELFKCGVEVGRGYELVATMAAEKVPAVVLTGERYDRLACDVTSEYECGRLVSPAGG